MLHKIATPLLYETIIVNCSEGFNPRPLDLETFSRKSPQLEYGPGLKHVKDLSIRSEFRDRLEARCYHNRSLDPDEYSESDYDLDDEEPDHHEEDFLHFCRQLRDNGLRSFRYEKSKPGSIPSPVPYTQQLGPRYMRSA